MQGFMSFLFLGWIAWAIVNAVIAREKGRSVWGVLALSLLLSPIIGYGYILAVPSLEGFPEEKIIARLQEIRDELRKGGPDPGSRIATP